MTEDNEYLVSHVLDKIRECGDTYSITHSSFLDLAQQSAVLSAVSKAGQRYVFWGGFEEAERNMCFFIPDYIDDLDTYLTENPDDCPMSVIRCRKPNGSPALSHRDYLGSVMGLGIKREKTGDIIVYDEGADIIIDRDIEEFMLSELKSVGRVSVDVTSVSINRLKTAEIRFQEKSGTVPSMRLDAVISEAFNMAREKSSQAIESGIVFLNGRQILKPDFKVNEGDKLVLRGTGKCIVGAVNGPTKKGRISVLFRRYI